MENLDGQREKSGGGALDGQVLAGRYRVARVVSTGANTVLVDAIDIETDNPVTVKIVRPEHSADPEFRRKFRKLAEVSNALTHPNIASVMDWGEIELAGESTVFWTVDALGGGSLRDMLDRGRLLEPGQALVVGLEACRALDAAHQKGLFHTELTPSKMVFGADRRVRVVDFGMARLLAEPAWADASAVPTHVARYASPEQALGLPVDAKTDVYALALVMIEAVSGSVPFAADSTVATLAGRVDKLLPVSADLGPLASVLERAGRPESSERFTAAEFGRALVQAAPRLPKPEPIPILASGQFDTTAMRRPTDPTGGVERPPPVPGLVGVDETSGTSATVAAAVAAAGAGAAVVAAGVVATSADAADGVSVEANADVDEAMADVPVGGSESAELADESADDAELEAVPGVETETDPAAFTEGRAAADTDSESEVDLETPTDPESESDLEPEIETESQPETETETESQPETETETETDTNTDTEPEMAAAESTDVLLDPVVPGNDGDDDLRIAGEPTIVAPVLAVDESVDAAGEAPGDSSEPVLFDNEPRRRRKAPIILLVILLLGGLGALGYVGSLLLQPKSFEVPVLAGVPDDEALNQIAGNDWVITVETERSDSFPELDTVIRTDPGPGVELEEGEPFTLVLSAGPEFRELPELDGLPFDAALTQLASLGLVGIEGPDRAFSETIPVESVISWQVQGDADASMQAGAQILPGETIVMTLSRGPEPRGVPDLAGQTIDEAVATLDALQLVLSQSEDVFSEDVPVGQIVSQDLAAASTVERGAIVTVQVSKGPDRIEFPSLEGLSYTDAETLLLETGFTVGSLLGTTDGTFVEATIDDEDVVVGTLFRRGQAIDLIFL